jgi:hypothetical protein
VIARDSGFKNYARKNIYDIQHLPPLFFAIDRGFFHLARFLLCSRASLEERVNYHSRVFEMILQPLSMRRQTLRFLFDAEGEYRYEGGPRQRICPILLPESLFTNGKGNGLFALVRTAISVPRSTSLPGLIHWVFFTGLLRHTISLDTAGEFCRALCNAYRKYMGRPVGLGLGVFERVFGCALEATLRYHNIGFFLQIETGLTNEFMLLLLKDMWQYLDRRFPQTDHRGTWRCPSLLCLTLGLTVRWPTDMLTSLPLAYPAQRWLYDSDRDLDVDDRIQSELFDDTIKRIVRNTDMYEPGLYETLVANDLDLCDLESPAADRLYEKGYRHGALFYFEIHFLFSLVVLTAHFLVALQVFFDGIRGLHGLSHDHV